MKTNLFAVLAAAFLLGACSNDNDVTDNPNGEVPAVFTTNLDSRVQTRAYDETWEGGDNIGIFSLKDEFSTEDQALGFTNTAVNLKYTRQSDQSWTSDNAYRFKNPVSTEVEFKAYYPWVEDTKITAAGEPSSILNGTIKVDATTQSKDGQKDFDFLFADKDGAGPTPAPANSKGSKADPNVKFQFTHSMAKVILIFKPDENKGVSFDADFKAMTPTLKGLKPNGTFKLADGTVEATGDVADLTLSNSTTGSDTDKTMTFIAIVPPQTPASDDTNAPEISIQIGTNNEYRSTKILAGTKMDAGKSYQYTITVRKLDLIISASDITNWEVGVGDGTGDATLQ